MRKLFELTVVFLSGWALALYFLTNTENERARLPSAPQNTTHTAPTHLDSKNAFWLPQSSGGDGIVSSNIAAIDQAKQKLAHGDIEWFMASLQQLRAATDEALWQDYRKEFFHALQLLKSDQRYGVASEWLTSYLRIEYDDVLALQALAEVHYLQNNYLAAIDTLYLAKSYAHNSAKIEQIVSKQRAITGEYSNTLQNRQNHLALLDLYQRLVSVEPEHSAHYVGLAQAYLALGNDADARRTLNIIAYDPETGAKAHQLLNLIESQSAQAKAHAEAITLSPLGNSLLTKALFNDRAHGWLLLDTGASLTVITPQLLEALSLNLQLPLRKAWFNTANGVVEAPIFMIDRINIGGQIVDHLEVAVMDLNNQHINGLLGMNFLQHFRFSIDQQNNVLYLSPRG